MSPSPTNAAASPEGEGGVRLDLWLWAARFFKTRALAKKAIELGQVRIDGQTLKPSRTVRPGLVLAIERAGERYEVEVRGVADQRGPASVAQQLYVESEASIAARLAGASGASRRRATSPRDATEQASAPPDPGLGRSRRAVAATASP